MQNIKGLETNINNTLDTAILSTVYQQRHGASSNGEHRLLEARGRKMQELMVQQFRCRTMTLEYGIHINRHCGVRKNRCE